MRKFLPYQQYDAHAIEQWLNKQSMAGYRLVKMDGFFPVFKRYIDHLYYYRVRYNTIGKPPAGYKYYWGKLYIYEEQDETKLPKATHLKDSMQAAQEQKKPFFALALLVALFGIITSLYQNIANASPLYIGAGCVAGVSVLAWLALIYAGWKRGRDIAKGELNPEQQPPNPKTKLLTTVACLVTIAAMLVVVVSEFSLPVTEKPETPEACVDAFFAGNYEYRTTMEQLDENGEIAKTVIEGKRTNGEKATEYYKYLECPYTLSWNECYAVETSNGTSSVKLHMSTDEWVLTTGYLGTPSYHENLKFVEEETVNGKVCEKYTTSYLWTVPKEYNLTDEENAALSNTTITLSYWLDKETGIPVKIVTDNGDALRWANIAYTYANRYASMQFNMTLEEAIALYPEETSYHNVQIFEVLDFGDHITIEDPHPSSK